jgi:hypothetical protein
MIIKVRDKYAPRKIFAWLPRRINDRTYAWLQFVWTKEIYKAWGMSNLIRYALTREDLVKMYR